MKRTWFIFVTILISALEGFSQVEKTPKARILFNGIVRDATTLAPLPNSQIKINRSFTTVSDEDGTFVIWVSRRDTVIFTLLGYQPAYFFVNDTLSGAEFMAGVYMRTDTLSIGEVLIMPRLPYLKYDILKAPVLTDKDMDNAKYNVAVSAYQGKMAISRLGDPASNYSLLRQQQVTNAYEKGTIPSDRIVGLSPLSLIGMAYLLIKGFPEKPVPLKSNLTRQELDQIQKKYLETLNKK